MDRARVLLTNCEVLRAWSRVKAVHGLEIAMGMEWSNQLPRRL